MLFFQMANCDRFLFSFFFFAQILDCGYMLEPPDTHNLCFKAKIRKNVYPCKPTVLQYKNGVYGGLHYTNMKPNNNVVRS